MLSRLSCGRCSSFRPPTLCARGLRLLAREAAEIEAAADLHSFYADGSAPLPDGVASPTDAELTAADDARW
jgi:hypothetical protein